MTGNLKYVFSILHYLLADDNASANQPISPKESSKASCAIEEKSGVTAAPSSTPM